MQPALRPTGRFPVAVSSRFLQNLSAVAPKLFLQSLAHASLPRFGQPAQHKTPRPNFTHDRAALLATFAFQASRNTPVESKMLLLKASSRENANLQTPCAHKETPFGCSDDAQNTDLSKKPLFSSTLSPDATLPTQCRDSHPRQFCFNSPRTSVSPCGRRRVQSQALQTYRIPQHYPALARGRP